MDPQTEAAVTWLLDSDEPAIRLMTRRDVVGEQADADVGQVLGGAKVAALLSGQRGDGGFGTHPYRKWTGAHWRLVSLVELGIPTQEPRAVSAAGHILAWLTGPARRVPGPLSWAALRGAFGPSFGPVRSPYPVSLGVLSLLARGVRRRAGAVPDRSDPWGSGIASRAALVWS